MSRPIDLRFNARQDQRRHATFWTHRRDVHRERAKFIWRR